MYIEKVKKMAREKKEEEYNIIKEIKTIASNKSKVQNIINALEEKGYKIIGQEENGLSLDNDYYIYYNKVNDNEIEIKDVYRLLQDINKRQN